VSRKPQKPIDTGRLIVVDPTSGLSGDMFLAGLFALGADPKRIEREVSRLPGLEPFRIVFGRVKRHGIGAHRVRVVCEAKAKHRHLGDILRMIGRSPLDARVKKLAKVTFELLGRVEGAIHGVPANRVHFHEVGAVDSIVDMVGAVVALADLGFPPLYHRPFVVGSGTVRTSHGELPVPAPATLELLKGRTVRFGASGGEVVTPTGAALMRALAMEISPQQPITPRRVVYSVGTRAEDEDPGMLRLIEAEQIPIGRDIFCVRTSIDDMNPELYQHIQELLFERGALEVYLTQLVMKKGRPGVLVTVLCEQAALEEVIDTLFRETTTLGVRISTEGRAELERWTETVSTPFGNVTVKRGRLPDGTVKTSPEYESCRSLARSTGVPIRQVYHEARISRGGKGSARTAVKRKRNTRKGGKR
jgi:uncharacterized protein (TIGR00299 family) protein